jgi:NAD(P)H dehydrogenase (quinone)
MSGNEKLLVTGASGNLGRLTLTALLKAGHRNLIATTRSPEKLREFARQGVDVRGADFKNPSTLKEAFKDATRILLISTTDVGQRVEDQKSAIAAAKTVGVQHVIYTSWPNPATSPAVVAPDHAATEKIIKDSGIKYTFLRNYSYAENLLFALPAAVESGTFYGSAGTGKNAYVTREDAANAAAGALIKAGEFENVSLNITGSTAYSHAEVAALVSDIKHKKVAYQDLPPDDFKAALIKTGLPDIVAQIFVSIDLAVKAGDLATTSDAVQRLSGKSPTGLADFLKANLE